MAVGGRKVRTASSVQGSVKPNFQRFWVDESEGHGLAERNPKVMPEQSSLLKNISLFSRFNRPKTRAGCGVKLEKLGVRRVKIMGARSRPGLNMVASAEVFHRL